MTDGLKRSFRLRRCTAALLDTEVRIFELISPFHRAALSFYALASTNALAWSAFAYAPDFPS